MDQTAATCSRSNRSQQVESSAFATPIDGEVFDVLLSYILCVRLCVCLSACVPAKYLKKFRTDYDYIFKREYMCAIGTEFGNSVGPYCTVLWAGA